MTITDLFADGNKPNLLLIITDQERSLQHWPETFAQDHLPSMTRLANSGITFTRAYTGSCMCSPSRATFLTSQYPSQTGVTRTGSPQPPHHLPTELANLADVLHEAGYVCAWRGKWHLGGIGPQQYGFQTWDPPDAGNYLCPNDTLGGGDPDNDGRYLDNMLDFIDERAGKDQPFCLVASFVNPHDVYMASYQPQLGYETSDFHKLKIPLPVNCEESLDTKPRGQTIMSWNSRPHANTMQEYVNFYAYLHTVVDRQIMTLLERFDKHNLTNDTLTIRFADHGEQALSHGLVEKFCNAYEESIRIPLIISNPLVCVQPQTTNSLVSSLDLVPTLTHLLGLGEVFSGCFLGKNIAPILGDPSKSVQDSVHFTYDDIPCREEPSIIRCIRTERYKYAVYFTSDGADADWELYDLEKDPNENDNKAGCEAYREVQNMLDRKLFKTMEEMKTKPRSFDWPPTETENSRGGAKNFKTNYAYDKDKCFSK
uniref:Sulfatase N-terminal domain-containing protein n=1 Tax=Trieres chinensis TaxID=1514140 RepID=A0A7S1ZUQ0_TRICV|mmetsp:Transcript_33173/g.67730  ORF Transcript_33173/g.67730 Transcript_33173/m.67730 type:complete len:483 (+) Transcript_33173:175-1623(+)